MTSWTLVLLNLAREFVTDSLVACFYAGFGRFILGVRMTPGRIALACAINVVSHVFSRHFVHATIFSYVITAIDLFLVCHILWRPRHGARFFIPFLICTVSMILNEIIISAIYITVYPQAGMSLEIAGKASYALQPYTYPFLFSLTVAYMCAFLCLVYWGQKLTRHLQKHGLSVLRILRIVISIALLFTVLAMFGLDFDLLLTDHTDSLLEAETMREKLFPYALYFAFAIMLCFYVWQDIQQFMLFRDNRSLLEKNAAYRRAIDSARESGHNMANMLYGLEGVILTRDVAQIEAYYTEMARRCARVNNKNAVALNRLKTPFLTSLLLRKFGDAEKKGVPLYLSVQKAFSFNALPPSALCEVLGNLVDNALDAAGRSDSPRVNIMMNSTPEYDEIIIANTYAENADLSFLSGISKSSKPDHQATGLFSVHRILKKYPDIYFNQFVNGRYIETSICQYKH